MRRRLFARIFNHVLHAFCVATLVLSCGLPSALHDLGHVLTQTTCATDVNLANQASGARGLTAKNQRATISNSSEEAACWIQALISSVAQHAPQGGHAGAASSAVSPNVHRHFVSDVHALSRDLVYWHTSRGPPAFA